MKTRTRYRATAATAALAALLAGVLALPLAASSNRTTADAWASLRLAGADEIENYSDVLQMRDASDLVLVGTFTSFTPGRTVTIPNGLGEGIDDQLFWIDGQVWVEEIITTAGNADPAHMLDDSGQTVTVEFFVGGIEEADYLGEDVTRLQTALGDTIGRAVLFLRRTGSPLDPGPANPCVDWPAEELEAFNMTPENCNAEEILAALRGPGAEDPTSPDAGLRLVWSYGLVAATADHPVDVPLGERPEDNPEGSAAHQHGGQTFAEPLDTWANLDEFIAYLRS